MKSAIVFCVLSACIRADSLRPANWNLTSRFFPVDKAEIEQVNAYCDQLNPGSYCYRAVNDTSDCLLSAIVYCPDGYLEKCGDDTVCQDYISPRGYRKAMCISTATTVEPTITATLYFGPIKAQTTEVQYTPCSTTETVASTSCTTTPERTTTCPEVCPTPTPTRCVGPEDVPASVCPSPRPTIIRRPTTRTRTITSVIVTSTLSTTTCSQTLSAYTVTGTLVVTSTSQGVETETYSSTMVSATPAYPTRAPRTAGY